MTPRPYKPANDRELGAFERRWCERCASWPADDLACPVWAMAQAYGPDAHNFPPQWVEGDDGPCCTAFADRDAVPAPAPVTDELFERRA